MISRHEFPVKKDFNRNRLRALLGKFRSVVDTPRLRTMADKLEHELLVRPADEYKKHLEEFERVKDLLDEQQLKEFQSRTELDFCPDYVSNEAFAQIVRWTTTQGGTGEQLVPGCNVAVEIAMLIFGKVPRRADRGE